MVFSLTGLAYFILFISLSFLTLRFFQYWQKDKTVTSRSFFLLGLCLCAFALTRVVSVFFFAFDSEVLKQSVVAVAFFQCLAASVVAYLIVHLKFPKISPWIGFSVIFLLGLVVTALTFDASLLYDPQMVEGKSFNFLKWQGPTSQESSLYSFLRMGVILITFLPLIIILFQRFLKSKIPQVKKRSLGLSIVLFLGIGIGFFDFILSNLFGMETSVSRDYLTIAVGVFIFITVFLTQRVEKTQT